MTATLAEYLAWEREQPEKHQYLDGEVYAMAGGSPRHNLARADQSSSSSSSTKRCSGSRFSQRATAFSAFFFRAPAPGTSSMSLSQPNERISSCRQPDVIHVQGSSSQRKIGYSPSLVLASSAT